MIKTRICGIPCQVEKISGYYLKPWRGSAHTAPSDIDYYGGWIDLEFEVYDRRGRKAPWLEKKMTEKDKQRIIDEIIEYERY